MGSMTKKLVPYSQPSIFFVNRPSNLDSSITQLERLTSDKHYNLLGQFLRYEEN